MTKIETYQRPETVPIWVEVKDWDGNYIDPSETILLDVYKPDRSTLLLDGVSMVKYATGKYVYWYTSELTDIVGWYRAVALIQDGTGGAAKYVVTTGGFHLE